MSKNTCRMIGISMMMVSVFFLIAGLYFKDAGLPAAVTPICLALGLVLLIAGIIFYKVLKND